MTNVCVFFVERLRLVKNQISLCRMLLEEPTSQIELSNLVKHLLAESMSQLQITEHTKDVKSRELVCKLRKSLAGLIMANQQSETHFLDLNSKAQRLIVGRVLFKILLLSNVCEKLETLKSYEVIVTPYIPILSSGDPLTKSPRRLPEDFIAVFRGFLERDYFPTSDEKEHYARRYKLSKQQIDNWLWNNRSRMRKRSVKGPTVDVTPKPTTATPAKKKKKVMHKGDLKMYSLEDVLDAINDIPNLTLTFTGDDVDFSTYFDEIPELFPTAPPPELFPSFIQELN